MKSTTILIKINTLLWQQWSLRTASTNAIIFSHDIVKSERINRHLYTFSPTGIHLSPYRFDWLRTIFTRHSELKYLLTNIWYFDNFIFFNRILLLPWTTQSLNLSYTICFQIITANWLSLVFPYLTPIDYQSTGIRVKRYSVTLYYVNDKTAAFNYVCSQYIRLSLRIFLVS